MAVTLSPNKAPAGTRPGSPIKVIEKQTDQGVNNLSAGVKIPDSALPGDIVVGFFWSGGNGAILPASFAADFMTIAGGSPKVGIGTNRISLFLLYYTVQAGDAGKSANLTWNYGGGSAIYALIVYTFRYALGIDFFGVGFPSGADSGLADTGHVVSPNSNDLVVAGVGAGAINRIGTSIQNVEGWYENATAAGALGLTAITGVVDIGYPYTWGGLALNITQGAPVSGSFAGWGLSLQPVQPPSAPRLILSPSGGSIDAAGTSGVPFGLTVNYTPVGGQGGQEALIVARQPTGGGAAQFLNMATQSWQATEYANVGGDPTLIFSPGLWVNDGTSWDLYAGIRESSLHYKSALAGPLTFTADPPPAITSVTITNPNSATPTVSWTESLSMAPQVGYRVRLFSADQIALPSFDPTNMLTGDDSDFELTIGTWQSLNSAVALGNAHVFTGSQALRLTANTTAGVSAFSASYPVTPGVQYYATGYVWADVTPRAMHLGISWQDIYGNQISTTSGTPVTDSTSAWTLLTVNGTPPAGAVTARLTVASTVSAVSEIHRLDQVYWAATPVPRWDSGMVLSTALTTVTGSLTGGLDYTAYVRALQTNDQVTPLKAVTNGSYVNNPTATFFNNRANPSVPTLVASPGTVPLTGKPQVNLALSGSATTALVEYSDDQVTWNTVRDGVTGQLATAVALTGSPTIYDREAPPGATRYYRATGYTGGLRSDHSAPVSAVAPLGQFWLHRPLTGDGMLLKIETSGGFKVKYPEDATQYPIGGRRNVVTIAEAPIHGAVITFTAMFTDQGSWDAFKVMREAQETLLLQSDMAGKQWYVRIEPEPEYDLKLTGSRLAGKPRRTLPLVLTEADRP